MLVPLGLILSAHMLDPSHDDEPSSAIPSCASGTDALQRTYAVVCFGTTQARTQIALSVCEGTTGGWVVEVRLVTEKEKNLDSICYSEYTD